MHKFGHTAGLGQGADLADVMASHTLAGNPDNGKVIDAPRPSDVSAMKSIYDNHQPNHK